MINKRNLTSILLTGALAFGANQVKAGDLNYLNNSYDNENQLHKISYTISDFKGYIPKLDKFNLQIYSNNRLIDSSCERTLNFSNETFFKKIICEVENLPQREYKLVGTISRGNEVLKKEISTLTIQREEVSVPAIQTQVQTKPKKSQQQKGLESDIKRASNEFYSIYNPKSPNSGFKRKTSIKLGENMSLDDIFQTTPVESDDCKLQINGSEFEISDDVRVSNEGKGYKTELFTSFNSGKPTTVTFYESDKNRAIKFGTKLHAIGELCEKLNPSSTQTSNQRNTEKKAAELKSKLDQFTKDYNQQFNKTFNNLTYKDSSIFTLGEHTYGNYSIMDHLYEIDRDGKPEFESRNGKNGFRDSRKLKFTNPGLCLMKSPFQHRDKSKRAEYKKNFDGKEFEAIKTVDLPLLDFASKYTSVYLFNTKSGFDISMFSPVSGSRYKQLSGKYPKNNQIESFRLYNIRFDDKNNQKFGKQTYQNLKQLSTMCKENSELVQLHRKNN